MALVPGLAHGGVTANRHRAGPRAAELRLWLGATAACCAFPPPTLEVDVETSSPLNRRLSLPRLGAFRRQLAHLDTFVHLSHLDTLGDLSFISFPFSSPPGSAPSRSKLGTTEQLAVLRGLQSHETLSITVSQLHQRERHPPTRVDGTVCMRLVLVLPPIPLPLISISTVGWSSSFKASRSISPGNPAVTTPRHQFFRHISQSPTPASLQMRAATVLGLPTQYLFPSSTPTSIHPEGQAADALSNQTDSITFSSLTPPTA